jgi:glycosyltransferase involved in cell wall biosynthesis
VTLRRSSMLDAITPVILTFNEAPNIGRTLEKLRWARRVVVVDSLSTDETLAIVAMFPNAQVFVRPINSLADQWNFAVHKTGIETEWVLRLDADYIVQDDFIAELAALKPADDIGAYRVKFSYCIHGILLRGSLYPTDYKLFRRRAVTFYQDGHTDRQRFSGKGEPLNGHILHDDRKPISRWLWAQDRYMAAEAKKLSEAPLSGLDLMDRLRRRRLLGPLIVFFYCLFWKGLILDGRAGLYYTLQRTISEMILALNLLDVELRRDE